MYPYFTNPIREIRGRTRNAQDSLNIFQDSHGPEGDYNPIFKVHLLGGVISQGLIGYITMVRNLIIYWRGEQTKPFNRVSMRVRRTTTGGKVKKCDPYETIYRGGYLDNDSEDSTNDCLRIQCTFKML